MAARLLRLRTSHLTAFQRTAAPTVFGAVVTSLIMLSLALFVRFVASGTNHWLPTGKLIPVSAAVMTMLPALHLSACRMSARASRVEYVCHGSVLVCAITLAFALSGFAGTTPARLSVWLLIGVIETGCWIVLGKRWKKGVATSAGHRSIRSIEANITETESQVLPDRIDAEDEELLPAGVTQQLTRSCDDEGESIAGVLRATFASDQRSEMVHVAFCPPLAAAPRMEVLQLDGPAAAIKVGEVQCYGARFEVRIHSAPIAPVDVIFQFEASLTATSAESRPSFH